MRRNRRKRSSKQNIQKTVEKEQTMFYERNKVLTMLEQKKIPLGIQCFTGNTELVEVMGATGFDFVMFDCVHSGNDVRAMEELVRTATLAGMASYIRVPDAHSATY